MTGNQGNIAIERATRQQLHDEYTARLTAADGQIRAMLAEIAVQDRQLAAMRQDLTGLRTSAARAEQAYRAGNIGDRAYVDLVSARTTKEQEIITLEQAQAEQQVAIATDRCGAAPHRPAGDRPMRMLLLLLALAIRPAAADESSVAVQTQPVRRGTVPALAVAYGTATPAIDGGMTLSLQQEGRVTNLAVTPGEAVHTGDRLMDFGVSAAASSLYTQAVTALDLAKTQRAHAAQLLAQQLATRDQLAQADKGLRDAQPALDALRRGGGGKPVQILTAPFDGIVSSIAVAQGDRLQPGAPLMVLTRLDGLVVTVGLDPAERAQVQIGAPASLQRLTGGPVLSGQVARIDAVVNAKTRLVDADITIPPGGRGDPHRAGRAGCAVLHHPWLRLHLGRFRLGPRHGQLYLAGRHGHLAGAAQPARRHRL